MKQLKNAFIVLISMFIMFGASSCATSKNALNNTQDPRIEVVNEKTIIFKDIVKIEIKTNKNDQVTYVYDLRHSKLIKVSRGSFEVNLPRGNYLIQSDKRITKTVYEIVIE
jgi:hypothetical protein